jgi:predicted enzyme related to lactoylglutathione lyase
MGNTVKHAPGTFCWVELTTSDVGAAKKFYSDLMGWETHDDNMADGGVYTMIRLDGGDVGGMFALNEQMKSQGVPPNWMNYITVDDAAATAAKAKELGGAVHMEAFDVMEIGTMAVLADPSGGVFAVWQPKLHTGRDHTDGRPGSVSWNELLTTDAKQADEFYTSLFGWGRQQMDMGPMGTYTIFMQGETKIGGMMEMGEMFAGVPSHWVVYFNVEDADASAEKVGKLGGQVLMPPTDIPNVGRFAMAADPQGAGFAFIKMAPQS